MLSCKWQDDEPLPFPLILSDNTISPSLLITPSVFFALRPSFSTSSVINALNTAAINGYAGIVDSLLAHGANTDIKDEVIQHTNTLFWHPSCIPYLRFYSILLYHIILDSILSYSILFYSILIYHITSYSILFYPILMYHITSYSILFYSILMYHITSYSILFYSILIYHITSYSILFYSILIYHITSYSILFYSILIYHITSYSILFYSTLS